MESDEIEALPTRELVGEIRRKAAELAGKELALAKAEMREELKHEVAMAGGIGVAGVLALVGLTMLFVTGALALGTVMAEWGAALIFAGLAFALGAIAFLLGWSRRVKDVMPKTRMSLKEDVAWTRDRLM